jgi:hypothetical protein
MTSRPKLTIGMATHRDFHGVYMTVQSLKMFHPDVMPHVELLVIDQAPDTPEGDEVRKLISAFGKQGVWDARYIPYVERIGTSASRDQVFKEARGHATAVFDCHIMVEREPGDIGGIQRIINYFDDPSHAKDILTGPILTDAVWMMNVDPYAVTTEPIVRPRIAATMATHYADHWRAAMWGTWASAWQCSCRKFNFAPQPDQALCRFETVEMSPKQIKECPACGKKFPLMDFAGHQQTLRYHGYFDLGPDGTEPFEIPGQGLGLFAMKTDAWPGFNTDAWGFGGEELYIHEKVRRNGGRAMCHPGIKWLHRFPRPGGANYPNSEWYKCRNYVLEFLEMGWDLSIIRDHFVLGRKFPVDEWEALVADPKIRVHGPSENSKEPVMVNGRPTDTYTRSLADIYTMFLNNKRDLNEHLPLIREVASGMSHVTAFTKRREWDAAVLMESPKVFISHNIENDVMMPEIRSLVADKLEYVFDNQQSSMVESIDPTDLLIIDTVHHADRLRYELKKFAPSVSRRIMVRGTGSFGTTAEGGGPGLFDAMREFVAEFPEWFVMYHSNHQYGLSVLSKDPKDAPPSPIIPWPPGKGVGTQLKKILEGLNIEEKPNCTCKARMIEMDRMGIALCEEHLDRIVQMLRENAPAWGWTGRLTDIFKPGIANAAIKAFLSGLAFKIDPTDPFPGLVREAIKRAKKEEEREAFATKKTARKK